jgi:uncharacterized membrane protein YwzB
MSLISILVGIVLGAAFSPFWMKLWDAGKDKVKQMTDYQKK